MDFICRCPELPHRRTERPRQRGHAFRPEEQEVNQEDENDFSRAHFSREGTASLWSGEGCNFARRSGVCWSELERMIKKLKIWVGAVLACLILPMTGQTNEWQQHVSHTIEVALDDSLHVLHGGIRTEYVNNSPDTLRHLWLHVWPNAYANGRTELAKQQVRQGNMVLFWAMQRELGGIDSLAFQVNDRPASWSFHPEHVDIVKLELPMPLLPGEALTYSTPFRVKLPSGRISRLGHIGQSYQITQWYPKPAVYDASGWHEMPYLNQGEFYSEYGAFDVTIRLPAAYTVGATGDFVPGFGDNDREVQRLEAIDAWTRGQIDIPDPARPFPGEAEGMKTLRYRQDNVHDFAWFADQNWWVLKDSVKLERSGRVVDVWAMFTPDETEWWKRAPEYISDATRTYSQWIGDYPYNHVTAVDGTISAGGGMEYPNVTVIGRTRSDLGLETVIVHEVGHNWFYGILGTNERENAWMDEGINSYYETRYFELKYGDSLGLTGFGTSPLAERLDLAGLPYGMRDRLAYLLSAQMGVDQPMQCHANEFADLNYGTIVYKKSAAAMRWLESSLGVRRFDGAMQAYFNRWKFRHPQPADFRAVVASATEESADWFFEDLVPSVDVMDVALRGARRVTTAEGPALRVKLLNKGGLEAPVSISAMAAGDSVWTLLRWEAPLEKGMRTRRDIPLLGTRADVDWEVLRLDAEGVTLDVNRTNDTRKMHGLFRNIEPLRFRLGTRLESADHTQVFWTPALAANERDGFMAGVALHNSTLPLRRSEWLLVPMWGTRSGRLTGLARYSLRLSPVWRWEASTSRFGEAGGEWYALQNTRNEIRLEGVFNSRPASPWRSRLSASLLDIRREVVDADVDAWQPFWLVSTVQRQAFTLQYGVEHERGLVKQSFDFVGRLAGETAAVPQPVPFGLEQQAPWVATFDVLQQQATLTYAFRQTRNRDDDTWGIRLFAGAAQTSDGQPLMQRLPLNSTGLGPQEDFLFDAMYGRRNETDAPNAAGALGVIQGGVYGTDLGTGGYFASAALVALRADWELPLLGLHVYAGGVVRHLEGGQLSSFAGRDAQFAAGFMWPLVDGRVEVGLPVWSTAWRNAERYEPWKSFAIAFNLRDASPFKIAREGLKNQR